MKNIYATNRNALNRICALLIITAMMFSLIPIGIINVSAAEENPLIPDAAYISAIGFTKIADGTAPWDTHDSMPDNSLPFTPPGDDGGPENGIVRSFDSIAYTVSCTLAIRDEYTKDHESFSSGKMHFEWRLPVSKEKAVFDLNSMIWIGSSTLTVESGVQVLRGWYELPNPGGVAIPASVDRNIIIKVQGAHNEDLIEPDFWFWLDGNDGNITTDVESMGDYKHLTETTVVSAAPSYNIELMRGENWDLLDYFDTVTGKLATASSNQDDVIYGRVEHWGITLQLYNVKPEKGLRGIEVPTGPFTFDLEVKMEKATGTAPSVVVDDVTDTLTPFLWNYKRSGSSVSGFPTRIWSAYGRTFGSEFGCTPTVNSTRTDGIKNNPGTWNAVQENNVIHVTVDAFDFTADNAFDFPLGRSYMSMSSTWGLVSGWGENIGCFSAGMFMFVIPLPEPAETAQFTVSIEDKNMNAVSVTGITQNNADQVKKDDDHDAKQMSQIRADYGATSYGKLARILGIGLSAYGAGDAWSAPDRTVTFQADVACNNSYGVVDRCLYSVDQLIKFDDRAFYIPAGAGPGSYTIGGYHGPYTYNMKTRILYAALKTHPETGWVSEAEMAAAKLDDFLYFATIDELTEAGYVCVAVLAEHRDGDPIRGNNLGINIPARVKNDETLIGNVYQILTDWWGWINESHRKPAELTHLDEDWEEKFADNPYDRQYFYNSAEYNADNPDNRANPYIKTAYNEFGQIIAGTHYSDRLTPYTHGNSCLIIGYRASVNILVSQISGGDEKKIFDLDSYQRKVDFTVTPKIILANGSPETGDTTEAWVTVTLPKELTYLSGTSIWGGTYNQGANPNEGTVTGGTPFEPTVTKNSNGTTTLYWFLDNVPVNEDLPKIYFSATIGTPNNPPTDVEDLASFSASAGIQAVGDGRAIKSANGNYAEKSVQVSKQGSTQLTKSKIKPLHEIHEPIGFSIWYQNNNSKDLSDMVLLDILPYNGDNRGTHFDGTYTIETVTVTAPSADIDGMTLRYTTDPSVRGSNAMSVNVSGWETAGKSVSGDTITFTVSAGNEITAIALTGTLTKDKAVEILYYLLPEGNLPENIYGNTATVYANELISYVQSSIEQAFVAGRRISGLTWIDENVDGMQDFTGETPESKLPGVEVQIYRFESDSYIEVTEDITGTAFEPILTATDGTYITPYLPAGDYQLQFIPPTGYTLTKYDAYTDNLAQDYSGEYMIIDIILPALDDMRTYEYHLPNQDAGFYIPKGSIEIIKDFGVNDDHVICGFDDDTEYTVRVKVDGSSPAEYVLVNTETNEYTGTSPSGNALTITANQSVTITKIPAGMRLTVEESVPTNAAYTATYSPTATVTIIENTPATVIVVNTYEMPLTSISVTKIWDDEDNEDYRLHDIDDLDELFDLYADSVLVTGVTPDIDDIDGYEYTYTWEDLPMYNVNANGSIGNEIVYTVEEKPIRGYEKTQDKDTDGATFTNKYNPSILQFVAQKNTNLPSGGLQAGQFEFMLINFMNYAPLPDNIFATNKTNGIIEFDPIDFTFEVDGNYWYEIREVTPSGGKWSCDGTVYRIMVPVQDGEVDYESIVYYKVDETEMLEEVNQIIFTNTFTDSYPVTLEVGKTVAGIPDGYDDITFMFELTEDGETGKDTKTLITGNTTSIKTITFDTITYHLNATKNDVKTHYYTIREVYPGRGWAAVPEIKVTVNVTYDGELDALAVEAIYSEAGDLSTESEEPLVLNNEYTPSGSLTVKKSTAGSGSGSQKFNITVTFTGDITGAKYTINGGTEQSVISNVVTLALAKDEEAVFTGIPVDVIYSVAEPTLPSGWSLDSITANADGVIADGDNGTVIVTNKAKPNNPPPEEEDDPDPTTSASTSEGTTEDETTTEPTTEETTEPMIEETTEEDEDITTTTEPTTDEKETTGDETTTESETEPTIEERTITTTTESTTETTTDEPATTILTTESQTESSAEPSTMAETVVLPEGIELLDELPGYAIPLSNGWFAVELGDDLWEVFDNAGVPLGVVWLPEGEDIEDYDVESNLIPMTAIAMAATIAETKIEPPRDNPKTGDSICVIFGLFILTLVAAIIFYSKKQSNS